MSILLSILLGLAGIIALILIIALFVRKNYNVRSEITVNAPVQKIFDYVKQQKNQDNFNKWVMADPEMKREFIGLDGNVGFIYRWNGNKKAGEGELEIKNLVEGKNVETEIRFIRPFPGVARANMGTETLPGGQTKVTWSNESVMKYPMNILMPLIEKMLAKDMHTSLINLKNILEK